MCDSMREKATHFSTKVVAKYSLMEFVVFEDQEDIRNIIKSGYLPSSPEAHQNSRAENNLKKIFHYYSCQF